MMAPEPPSRSTTDRRVWLGRVALAASSVVLPLLLFEILLVARALPLSEAAARYVHGCYEPSQPSRNIHATIRPLKLKLHRPNFETDCYFFGYHWRHRSDGYGWRNPETWESADLVVLGDSIVYGHGVDEEQTTAHFLRGLLQQRVVNMGMTGASPVHYLAYLHNFALPLEPRVVVVFFFTNDLQDLRKRRSPEQLASFVASGKGRETRVLPRATLLGKLRFGSEEASWLDRLAVYRLAEYRLRAWRPSRPAPEIDSKASRWDGTEPDQLGLAPPPDELLDRMEARPTIAYIRRALSMMAESSRQANASLVVGHIGRRKKTDWLLRRVLRQTSVEQGFHYFETPVLEGRYRLPNDGHLSEDGHRRLAETLAAYLKERGLT